MVIQHQSTCHEAPSVLVWTAVGRCMKSFSNPSSSKAAMPLCWRQTRAGPGSHRYLSPQGRRIDSFLSACCPYRLISGVYRPSVWSIIETTWTFCLICFLEILKVIKGLFHVLILSPYVKKIYAHEPSNLGSNFLSGAFVPSILLSDP